MREANIHAGHPVCVGDFRNLSKVEIDIALEIEPTVPTELGWSSCHAYDLGSKTSIARLRDFVKRAQAALGDTGTPNL